MWSRIVCFQPIMCGGWMAAMKAQGGHAKMLASLQIDALKRK